jgi:hypothetical protein
MADMDKLTRHGHVTDRFILDCRGSVSLVLRDDVKTHAMLLVFRDMEIWSGTEFEERLRQSGFNLFAINRSSKYNRFRNKIENS